MTTLSATRSIEIDAPTKRVFASAVNRLDEMANRLVGPIGQDLRLVHGSKA